MPLYWRQAQEDRSPNDTPGTSDPQGDLKKLGDWLRSLLDVCLKVLQIEGHAAPALPWSRGAQRKDELQVFSSGCPICDRCQQRWRRCCPRPWRKPETWKKSWRGKSKKRISPPSDWWAWGCQKPDVSSQNCRSKKDLEPVQFRTLRLGKCWRKLSFQFQFK